MSAVQTVPARSLQQRLGALEHANEIRFARARLKQDVRAGRVRVVDVLADPPSYVATMKVYELLLAQWRWGAVKAQALLRRSGVSTVKTVGGLSEGQRRELMFSLWANR